MKYLKCIIIFLVTIMCNKINAQTPDLCSKIDSICILSLDLDAFYATNMTRFDFERQLLGYGKFDIVKDRDKIEDICTLLNDLNPYESCDCKSNINVIIHRGVPRLFYNDITIDVRSLLVLYMQNTQTLVWVGVLTEYDCKLYGTSEKLYSFLRDYKHKYYFKEGQKCVSY